MQGPVKVQHLEENLQNILDEGVKKSVKYFNKKIRKMLTGTTHALQKINYSIGQE